MARLPEPGKDNGTWGNILNDYLSQVHKSDGTLKDNIVTANTLAPNSVTNAAIASDAVNTTSIADGSITNALLADGTIAEVKLASAVQTKLNSAGGAADWNTLTNKPAVIATGADQASARVAIGAGMAQRDRYGSRMVVDGDSITIRPGTSSTWNNSPGGWSMEMARLSNGRIDLVYNAGVPATGIAIRLSNFASKVPHIAQKQYCCPTERMTLQACSYLTI